MAFIVEDGSIVPGANSLVTVEEADSIMAFDPFRGEAWVAKAVEAKEKLLVFATRYLSLSFRFNGKLVDPEQPLPFPRKELRNPETGLYFPEDKIMERVKQAVIELAVWFDERQSANFFTGDDVTLVRSEDIEINFNAKGQKDTLPLVVSRLLEGVAEFITGDVTYWKIRKA